MDRLLFLVVLGLLVAATVFSTSSQERQSPQSGTSPFGDVRNIIGGHDVAEPTNEQIAASEQQSADLASGSISYRAFLKRTRIEDRHDVFPPADVISFSYEADGDGADPARPVVFLFNGGPGSSSIWLHMTGFGPYKTSADLINAQDGEVPLTHEENPGFLIDVADLVFVDPIGTGLSSVVEGGSETAFRDLRVDARAMCRFAQNWLEAENRVGAPVYVVGVSYSTLRAAGMASHPNCKDFRKQLHGLIFVSGLLDLRMRHARDTAGRISRYPTIAAIAWQRGLVDRARWPDGFEAFLADMEAYADTVIGPSLTQAHLLPAADRRDIMDELHTQIGLAPPNQHVATIAASLRNAQKQVDGTKTACQYDARFDCGRTFGSHPDLPLLPFGGHLETILVDQWREMTGFALNPQTYRVIRGGKFRANWDYRFLKSQESGAGTDMADIMRRRINPPKPLPVAAENTTRIMVASGLFDLVTPYYAMELALLRAGLTPSQFDMHVYEGGHMMYLEKETGHQLAADIRSFIRADARPS